MSEGSLKVFTRSQHLEEVGFCSNDQVLCDVYTVATGGCEQSDGSGVGFNDQVLCDVYTVATGGCDGSGVEPLAQRDGPFLEEGEAVTSKRTDIAEMCAGKIQPDPCGEETQWEQFKSEFTDTLESSEQHIEEETHPGTQGEEGVRCLRQQLLIDAITALHSETAGEKQAGTHSATEQMGAEQIQESPESWSTVDNHSGEGAASNGTISDMSHLSSYPSTSSDLLSLRQTGVLSLGRLETIHESKLDRMLELVESGTQPDAVWEKSPIVGSRGQGRNQPPLVWEADGDSGSEVLMKELEQLSENQSKQTVSTGTSTSTDARDIQQGRYIVISEICPRVMS